MFRPVACRAGARKGRVIEIEPDDLCGRPAVGFFVNVLPPS
jgi:hypothetical protein